MVYVLDFEFFLSGTRTFEKRCFLWFISRCEVSLTIFKSSIVFVGDYLYHQIVSNGLKTFALFYLLLVVLRMYCFMCVTLLLFMVKEGKGS